MIEYQINKIKYYLQNKVANIKFPVRELWFNNNTLNFWGFDIENDILFITFGKIKNNNIIEYQTRTFNNDIENILNNNLHNIMIQGYNCFCMLL